MAVGAYIFDIDGTLADCSARVEEYLGECKNWDQFYAHCDEDKRIDDVMMVLAQLRQLYIPLFVTGRPERCRQKTRQWLAEHGISGIQDEQIFMRADNDHRQDYIFKKEVYEKHIKGKYKIMGVFEDRNQCVDMWRSLGLTCFQVRDGSY